MKHFCRIGGILIACAGLIPAFMPDPSHPLGGHMMLLPGDVPERTVTLPERDEVRDIHNSIIAISCAALGYLLFRAGSHFGSKAKPFSNKTDSIQAIYEHRN
jgi:hypothetical protein